MNPLGNDDVRQGLTRIPAFVPGPPGDARSAASILRLDPFPHFREPESPLSVSLCLRGSYRTHESAEHALIRGRPSIFGLAVVAGGFVPAPRSGRTSIDESRSRRMPSACPAKRFTNFRRLTKSRPDRLELSLHDPSDPPRKREKTKTPNHQRKSPSSGGPRLEKAEKMIAERSSNDSGKSVKTASTSPFFFPTSTLEPVPYFAGPAPVRRTGAGSGSPPLGEG